VRSGTRQVCRRAEHYRREVSENSVVSRCSAESSESCAAARSPTWRRTPVRGAAATDLSARTLRARSVLSIFESALTDDFFWKWQRRREVRLAELSQSLLRARLARGSLLQSSQPRTDPQSRGHLEENVRQRFQHVSSSTGHLWHAHCKLQSRTRIGERAV
jgi:hypothetical protein